MQHVKKAALHKRVPGAAPFGLKDASQNWSSAVYIRLIVANQAAAPLSWNLV